jgi:hypothetical protein
MIHAPMETLGRLASRIVAGTAVYIVIVALAAPLPAAAGLMLTFPALNGLAFYFSENERAAAIAKTMFFMPIVNGALCAAYVALFLLLARVLPPTEVGWGLLVAAALAWYAWVSRRHVRAGIAPAAQAKLAIATTLAGIALATATILALVRLGALPTGEASAAVPASVSWIANALARGELKIALFAVTLAVFVVAIHFFPMGDSTRGILAGLPIVPFGGLLSIGVDSALDPHVRVATYLGMASGVWLGPPIAMWFIFFFSRYLGARKPIAQPAADSLLRFGALVLAWIATFAMIGATAYALNALAALAPSSTP